MNKEDQKRPLACEEQESCKKSARWRRTTWQAFQVKTICQPQAISFRQKPRTFSKQNRQANTIKETISERRYVEVTTLVKAICHTSMESNLFQTMKRQRIKIGHIHQQKSIHSSLKNRISQLKIKTPSRSKTNLL